MYVFGAVEHYHFVTAAGLFFSTFDRRYPYPVGGRWAALTTNYCVVVVVALATTQWRRAPSSPQISTRSERSSILLPINILLDAAYKGYISRRTILINITQQFVYFSILFIKE